MVRKKPKQDIKSKMPVDSKVFFDGGEIEKKDGWRANWIGTVKSHEHPHSDVVMVKPDNSEYSIPIRIYELTRI